MKIFASFMNFFFRNSISYSDMAVYFIAIWATFSLEKTHPIIEIILFMIIVILGFAIGDRLHAYLMKREKKNQLNKLVF